MDAIIQVFEDWSFAKDKKKAVLAIFIDFAKAFDLVDHEILLEKLSKHALAYIVDRILSDRAPPASCY